MDSRKATKDTGIVQLQKELHSLPRAESKCTLERTTAKRRNLRSFCFVSPMNTKKTLSLKNVVIYFSLKAEIERER